MKKSTLQVQYIISFPRGRWQRGVRGGAENRDPRSSNWSGQIIGNSSRIIACDWGPVVQTSTVPQCQMLPYRGATSAKITLPAAGGGLSAHNAAGKTHIMVGGFSGHACVCLCVCMHVRASVCVCACVCVSVWVGVWNSEYTCSCACIWLSVSE